MDTRIKSSTILALIFTFAFLFAGVLFSQSSSTPPTDVIMNPFWDFYATNYLNGPSAGMGNTGVASDNSISGVSLNPASLNMLNGKYQFGIQYTYKSAQPWLQNLRISDLSLKQYVFSGSASLGYRVNKNFQTGLIYSNPTSMYLDMGTVIRTDEFGNEIGRYDAYEKYVIHSITVPLVYQISKLRVGLNLSYSIFSHMMNWPIAAASTGVSNVTGSFGKLNGQFGIQYRPNNILSFGLSVTPELRSEFVYNFPDGASDQSQRSIYPWKLAAGIEVQVPNSRLRFEADYNYSRTKVIEYLKDRNDFNFGGEYTVNEKYKVRAGFFTLLDYRTGNNFADPIGQYNQYFLTAGASMKLKNLQIDLSILDSHMSPGIIKNTYINASISYSK